MSPSSVHEGRDELLRFPLFCIRKWLPVNGIQSINKSLTLYYTLHLAREVMPNIMRPSIEDAYSSQLPESGPRLTQLHILRLLNAPELR
jgi:hypothetical protein